MKKTKTDREQLIEDIADAVTWQIVKTIFWGAAIIGAWRLLTA